MSSAYVFPGQGSQTVGMQQSLADSYPIVRATYTEASDCLEKDLWTLMLEGPDSEMQKTVNTQPLLLTASVAAWRISRDLGLEQPVVLAGHSLGEYSALVAAGSLAFNDAVTLVAQRGQFMQDAVPAGEGAMAVVLGLDDGIVSQICAESAGDDVVEAVNFNSPGQVAIAGARTAVERACALAKESGARRAMLLPVSVPSHCALMRPAAERLRLALQDIEIATPEIPVINNVDVRAECDADAIRDALVRQLYSPVRWVETVQEMVTLGVEKSVECGPGKVLSGLIRRIDKSLSVVALSDQTAYEKLGA